MLLIPLCTYSNESIRAGLLTCTVLAHVLEAYPKKIDIYRKANIKIVTSIVIEEEYSGGIYLSRADFITPSSSFEDVVIVQRSTLSLPQNEG